jgi:hypothetical protein
MIIINQENFNQTIQILTNRYPKYETYFNSKFKKFILKDFCHLIGYSDRSGINYVYQKKNEHASKATNSRYYSTAKDSNGCWYHTNDTPLNKNFIIIDESISNIPENSNKLYLFDTVLIGNLINQKMVSIIWYLETFPKYLQSGTSQLLNEELFKSFSTAMLQFNCKVAHIPQSELFKIIQKFDIKKCSIIELNKPIEFQAAGSIMSNCLGNHVRKNSYLFKHKIIQYKFYGVAAIEYRRFICFDFINTMLGYSNHKIETPLEYFNIFQKLDKSDLIKITSSLIITKLVEVFFYSTMVGFTIYNYIDGFHNLFYIFFNILLAVSCLPPFFTAFFQLLTILSATKSIIIKNIK